MLYIRSEVLLWLYRADGDVNGVLQTKMQMFLLFKSALACDWKFCMMDGLNGLALTLDREISLFLQQYMTFYLRRVRLPILVTFKSIAFFFWTR